MLVAETDPVTFTKGAAPTALPLPFGPLPGGEPELILKILKINIKII